MNSDSTGSDASALHKEGIDSCSASQLRIPVALRSTRFSETLRNSDVVNWHRQYSRVGLCLKADWVNECTHLSVQVWNVAALWPQKLSFCSLVAWTTEAAAGHSFRGPPSTLRTHTQPCSRERAQRVARGFYWIKPLLTVLEYDGKNLGTQGGLCQHAMFA